MEEHKVGSDMINRRGPLLVNHATRVVEVYPYSKVREIATQIAREAIGLSPKRAVVRVVNVRK